MAQSKEAGEAKPGHKGPVSLAIVPVSTPAFIQQARIPGQQVQRRNSSTMSQAVDEQVDFEGNTLMPVNIKQILDSWAARQYNYIVINSTRVSSVKVIGQVRGKQVDEYKGTFTLEDCSGLVKASLWFTCGRTELDRIPEGAYAAAIGRVKIHGDSPELQCYDCRPITNFNDITHHHLSVIATHIDNTMKPEKTIYQRLAELWAEDMAQSSSREVEQAQQQAKMPATPKLEILSQDTSPVLNIAEAPLSGSAVTSNVDLILKLLRDEAPNFGPQGVHIDLLSTKLTIGKEAVRKFLAVLASEGEVYTTIDCDHFAAT